MSNNSPKSELHTEEPVPTMSEGTTVIHDQYYDKFHPILTGPLAGGVTILTVAVVGAAEWDWTAYQGAFDSDIYKSGGVELCTAAIKNAGNKIMKDEAMKIFGYHEISKLLYRQ